METKPIKLLKDHWGNFLFPAKDEKLGPSIVQLFQSVANKLMWHAHVYNKKWGEAYHVNVIDDDIPEAAKKAHEAFLRTVAERPLITKLLKEKAEKRARLKAAGQEKRTYRGIRGAKA